MNMFNQDKWFQRKKIQNKTEGKKEVPSKNETKVHIS